MAVGSGKRIEREREMARALVPKVAVTRLHVLLRIAPVPTSVRTFTRSSTPVPIAIPHLALSFFVSPRTALNDDASLSHQHDQRIRHVYHGYGILEFYPSLLFLFSTKMNGFFDI